MQSNFNFLAEKFPKLAEYGRKAEKYLYADNEVCMFFISRIFDNVVKYLCAVNNVNNDGIRLAEPINDLFQKNAIDEGVYLLLETMRIFRNGNAHNKDYSLNESMILLQVSHILCEWLMENYGKTGYKRKGFTMPGRDDFKPVDVAECSVNSSLTFGVFAPIVEVNDLPHNRRIPSGAAEGYNVGDTITAKVIGIDSTRGHIAVSIIQPKPAQPPAPPQPKPQPAQPPAPPQPQLPAISDDAFISLCMTGTAQKVRAAITNGANVNAANSKGRTALMLAVLKNPHYEVIDLLLDSGANPSVKSKKGVTALGYAPHNPHLHGTKTLARLQALGKK